MEQTEVDKMEQADVDKTFIEAIQRAKEIAAIITSNNAIGVKRTQDDDLNLEPAKKFLEDLPTTSENQEIVTMIDVPPSYTGLVVGKGGFKINQIKSESGCSVAKLAPQTHPETRQFILKGTPEQVNCAKMLIQNVVDAAKLAKSMQTESQLQVPSQSNVPHLPIEVVTIEVLIPKEKLGSIVGKGGENINNLQQQLNVKLQLIQKSTDASGPKPLQISGYSEQVELARRYIIENFCKTDQFGVEASQKNQVCTSQVIVPGKAVGKIIGTGGENIKWLTRETGAKILFDKDDKTAEERVATIHGTSYQVNYAVNLIKNLIDGKEIADIQLQTPISPSAIEVVSIEVLIPKENLGSIVGKGGEMIHNLQQQLNVKLQLIQKSNEAHGPKPLQITGYADKVEAARLYIQEHFCNMVPAEVDEICLKENADALDELYVAQVIVLGKHVGRIIGPGGEHVKWLNNESGAKVSVKTEKDKNVEERTATVQGTFLQVKLAIKLINDLLFGVEVPAACVNFFWKIPSDKLGIVLGKGGCRVKQMAQESGTKIQVMDQPADTGERVFEIRGKCLEIQHAVHLIKIQIGNLPSSLTFLPSKEANKPIVKSFQKIAKNVSNENKRNNSSIPTFNFSNQKSALRETLPLYNQNANVLQHTYNNNQSQVSSIPAREIHQSTTPTTQPDYTNQWIEYYREMGMHAQAVALEQIMKESRDHMDHVLGYSTASR